MFPALPVRKLLWQSLLLACCAVQCRPKATEAPEAEGFDPPIPPTISYVAGPITFQLQELEDKINRELDPVLIGKHRKDGKAKGIISFRVKRMGKVHVAYRNNQVHLSAPLQMWLTKPFSHDTTPPKTPFCALHVNFQSPIRVTSNWRFASHTQFTDYQWIVQPKLRVLGNSVTLTKIVQSILDKHRTDIETAIDSAIHTNLRLDKMVRPIWRDLQKPLLINRDYGLWLLPTPISVAAGPVTGNQQQLTTHLRIAFNTKTELKPHTPNSTQTALPLLQKRDSVSQNTDLHLNSFIPYADINRILRLTIARNPTKMALGTLTLKGATVYGAQHALIVKADLDGLIDGPVYLRGRPTFDTLTNTLRITQLDFDTNTNKGFAKTTGSLWHKVLRNLLQSLLTIRLGDEISQLPQKINQAYEKGPGKKTDLALKNFRFTPETIAIRPDGIQALIHVQSRIGVSVNTL